MIFAHVPLYFLENTMLLLAAINLGTKLLPTDANLVLWFPNEFVPLAVLPLLNEEAISDIPMVEAEEDTVNEEEDTGKGDYSDVEAIKATPNTRMSQRKKPTRTSQKVRTIASPTAKKAKAKTPTPASLKARNAYKHHFYTKEE